MNRIYTAVFALLLLLPSCAPKWQPLFNGENLDGWTLLNGDAEYKVVDGTIVGTTVLDTPNSFLASNLEYSDFIFEFEFKVDDALNSGVQFRSHSLAEYQNGRVHGYQYEIDPSDRAWSGGVYDEARRAWLYPMTLNPASKTAFKNGEWNKARIEAYGNQICTWLNDIPCTNLWDDADASGFIALQVHSIWNNEELAGKEVAWRNLRICTKNVKRHLTKNSAPQISAIPNVLCPEEQAQGYKLLWDGKTSDGWRSAKAEEFPSIGWVIEDGILKAQEDEGEESAYGGDIITREQYGDFILKVEFKLTEGANSGIKYFVNPNLNQGEGSAIGCEWQILDDNVHPDAKAGINGNRTLGSLYDLIPAPANKQFYFNNWSVATVIVKGNHVEHWLDGSKLLEYERNSQMWDAFVDYSKYQNWDNFGNAKRGHILLQDHGNEVWFRSIRIKEL